MAETNTNAATGTEGTQGAAQGSNQTQTGTQTQQTGESNPTQAAADNKGEKLFTQADLDAKIAERLARERKKYQNQPAGAAQEQTPPATEGAAGTATTVNVDVTEDARQQATAIIAQANQRMIQAIAHTEATKLNIHPDYIVDAVKLADLSGVQVAEDGTVDTKSITTALEAVLTRIPVLKAAAEAPTGGFKVGGQGGNSSKTNGWGNGNASKTGETKRWNKNRY